MPISSSYFSISRLLPLCAKGTRLMAIMKSTRNCVGEKIRAFRKEKGFTQSQLAEITKLSDNFIGYIERGETTPSLHSLERIAQALSVELQDLFEVNKKEFNGKPATRDEKEWAIQKVANELKSADLRDVRLILQLLKLRKRRIT